MNVTQDMAMENVQLTQDGRLLGSDSLPAADPLPVLSFSLTLEEGCTLRSFFAMLHRYPVLLKLSEFLPATLADAEKCPSSGCLSGDIDLLVVGKTMELIGFPGKPRAELYFWLRGQTAEPGESGSPSGSCGRDTSLEGLMHADRETRFIPLQVLLDTPLFLGGLKHVVLGDVNRSLLCATRFSLFEVIDGLAWEFGFQGGTQQCSIGR